MAQFPRECPATGSCQVVPNGYPAKPEHADPPPRSLYDVCLVLKEKLDAFLAEDPEEPLLRKVQARLHVSMGVVEQTLKTYRLEQIAISYNGGKDCLVLLVIYLASIARCFSHSESCSNKEDIPNGATNATPFPRKLHAIYIVSAQPFPEIDAFVESSSSEYHLDTARFRLPMKEGLEVFLKENQNIQAIFVGTRRTDPHGEKLKYFDPTDSGWPSVMRLHPVLDWRLAEIWTFIRHLGIPYCSLYDQGYTSLGGKLDTHPNPRLKKEDGNMEGFRPAYELMEDDGERLGRYG